MITLLLLLPFLSSTIAIDDVNVPFSKETKLLVLNKLQWRLNHASIPHLPQRSRTVEGTTILEMKLTKPREEDLMKFLASDDARVSSLQFRIRNGSNDGRAQEGSSSMEVQIPLSSGAKLSTLNYVVTVELGGRKMTVIVNTGRNSGICSMDQQSCSYSLSYGDGSYSHGVLSSDEYQSRQYFGGVFSYCLPTSEFESSGSLVLGSNSSVYRNSTPITYTRLITDPLQAPFYYLNLTSISVGGMALQASGFSDGRILIDSRTVITRLVPSVYRALRNEFVKQFSDYPPAPGFSILDTCFNLTGYKEVNIPTLRLKFEGEVEVSADATGVLYFVQKDASQVCLAFC
ncbi:hypothetical protein J5N97_026905 [Dioscorea zingiberensis]|uniref:Peptidase A1 domain-containing protein n=1 Tax=Dioscorea zingiberensis TaxID=325984 RepID=A0A9D5C342_9LILI|nr:hypothetical protein J5N97_026905 [Dioscorea zingiberensis]